MSSEQLRSEFREKLDDTVKRLNEVLQGQHLVEMEPILKRIGQGGAIPHWYGELEKTQSLPNLDGKTIGSVIEMLLLGVLETFTFADRKLKLRINPARGTDLPDLDLSVKSPSTNYCTSEPFFSAYERLIGGKHDAIILLTDYQSKKKTPPLKLQILKCKLLKRSEIADVGLCSIALKNREHLLGLKNDVWAQKYFRFLAHVNQSDWLGKQLLIIAGSLHEPEKIPDLVKAAENSFKTYNAKGIPETGDEDFEALEVALSDEDLRTIQKIPQSKPLEMGLIDALDTWVVQTHQEAARMPGADEWKQLKEGPLDGKIGMSFALQWRFNFGRIFRINKAKKAEMIDAQKNQSSKANKTLTHPDFPKSKKSGGRTRN